jgi:chorismate mutase
VSDSDLVALRKAIDDVDGRLLELIAERVRLVLEVGAYKAVHDIPIYDPERERLLLERLTAQAPAPLEPETVRRIFERLIDESRRLEQRHGARPTGKASR